MPTIRTNSAPSDESTQGSSLSVAPRKKHTRTHVYVGCGRHFGRTVYAFADMRKVIENGLNYDGHSPAKSDVAPSLREIQEYKVYTELLAICSGLEERLLKKETIPEDVDFWADLIQKGMSAARGEDTKGMKGPIIDWVTPRGGHLIPPLNCRQKIDRGFYHKVTSRLLCPAHLDWENDQIKVGLRSGELTVPGQNWPIFLYENYTFDPTNLWKGLLKSVLLVMAFKHIFIAPSSVDVSDKDAPTKGGNAEIHGMKKTTSISIVYTATQVRFALLSAPCWSRSDRNTDSENFYGSLLTTLEDPVNSADVTELLMWWDRRIFPHSRPDTMLVAVAGSPLDCIRQIQVEKTLSAGANSQAAATNIAA